MMVQPSGPGPSNPPPPPGPGRAGALDPESQQGRAVAHRLTRTLAAIETEIADRRAASEAAAA